MARYFFNLYNGKEIFDPTGVVLSSVDEVETYMLALAKAWVEVKDHQHTDWLLEARDENENIVGSMRFGLVPDDA